MIASRIDGVTLTELRQIVDERGAVLHLYRSDSPGFTGFGECYFSEVRPGVVKGWKRHRLQTQNLAVPSGRMRVVLFDDREGSPSRGELQVLELGRPDSYLRLRVPPFVWYGFSCISAEPALFANVVDIPHDPTEGETRPLSDPSIPYSWAP
jgi:dTDP-4-dehydrorhamnose 3,5-epimerase